MAKAVPIPLHRTRCVELRDPRGEYARGNKKGIATAIIYSPLPPHSRWHNTSLSLLKREKRQLKKVERRDRSPPTSPPPKKKNQTPLSPPLRYPHVNWPSRRHHTPPREARQDVELTRSDQEYTLSFQLPKRMSSRKKKKERKIEFIKKKNAPRVEPRK